MIIRGTYTALITPFKNNEVDYIGLRKNIRYQIASGVTGIVSLGTSAETPTLTREEQDNIIQVTLDEAKNKIQVIVGCGTYDTRQTIENVVRAEALGADATLVVTPYYNKPTNEGIFLHYKAIVKVTNIPIILYNISLRTGKNMDVNLIKRLADLENIISIKEASGNIEQMMNIIDTIKYTHSNFTILSGDDSFTLPLLSLGGDGVISVATNLIPKPVVSMVDSALNENFIAARKMHYKLLPLFKGLFIETNPIPIKEAMTMCGMDAGDLRLPLCNMIPENKEKLHLLLKSLNLLDLL
jgi:4-hydroxy-tetrahydrodipicolinate synthase